MQIAVPNYYKEFSCIAGECRHSCCIGWEIDIDADTYGMYTGIEGELGERLKKSISCEGEPHFILGKDERCPFLNSKGLCDIITECGEGALCDICADHPRFRNFYSDRTEIGLGLCCEAAAALILGFDKPFGIEVIEDDGEDMKPYEDEIAIRAAFEKAVAIAQDRTLGFADRCNKLTEKFSVAMPAFSPSELAKLFYSLERLDKEWNKCLDYLDSCERLSEEYSDERAAENLLCYFLFRHMPSALDDGVIASKVGFAVLSCRVVMTLSRVADIEEAARMYSSEIEYSDENLERMLSIFNV